MKKYGIHDATVILGNYIEKWVEFDVKGVVLSQQSLNGVPAELLQWKYACELDGPDAPNPLTAPCPPASARPMERTLPWPESCSR